MAIAIKRYTPAMQREWDELVRRSRNGTFLHERGYMDYHSDRFDDCSLMALAGNRLVAILPACQADGVLYSHQGLTYGGWIMPERKCDTAVMMDVVDASIAWLRDNGFKSLVYKPVPHIYHRYPAEDDIYALVAHGAALTECSVSTTIDLSHPLPFDRGNKSGLQMARRQGITAGVSEQWDAYWHLLADVLAQRHDTRPVHTLDEMLLLRDRFPENIVLYTATEQGKVLAGVVMYFTHTTAHCQYIAASDEGRRAHALTLLMDRLINHAARQGLRYFDFGISTEDHGRLLNRGLAEQKARLGGRGTITQVYRLPINE